MKDVVICRCEEVMLSEIITSIKNGTKSAKELKLRTRAGMGVCQGRICRLPLEQIVSYHTNKSIPPSSTLSFNNPVRPLTLSELAQNRKESCL
ncbi:(2Fe-2S)-binding protein [Virgibacillus byunsanensis]|uniref:(2Fe-2S)-binding protein n=1 Tax=Virgibacillus byunsanensis TaxID=570945 RepID=A0ABW3LML5_9BACI